MTPLEQVKSLYESTFNLSGDDRWVPDFVLCVLAQFKLGLESELAWSILVGPPGCGKTEMTRPAQVLSWTYEIDDLTPKSFVSHFELNEEDTEDKSLLLAVRGKVVLIPDLTVLISKNPKERKEVLGTLRRCYDRGQFSRASGVGQTSIRSDFGLLACCTGEIDPFLLEEAAMGERFLKLRMWRDVRTWDRDIAMANWAMKMSDTKSTWRSLLRESVKTILAPFGVRRLASGVGVPEGIRQQLTLAVAGLVRARIIPMTEKDRVKEFEAVQRLVQSLSNLGHARALLDNRTEWNQTDLDFVLRVGLDTLPLESTIVIHRMYKWPKEVDSAANLARRCRLPLNWMTAVLRQFVSSGLTEKLPNGKYQLTRKFREVLRETRLGLTLPENPGTHENFGDPAVLGLVREPRKRTYTRTTRKKGTKP